MPARDTVPAAAARRLLLDAQGLFADPVRKATPAAVRKQIEAMGFVQVDTINIAIRAHHHILATRFDDYHPRLLEKLLERDRSMFEHWTHDASIVPSVWYPAWKVRFAKARKRGPERNEWWKARFGGEGETILRRVKSRVRREGPVMSKDFDHPERTGPWWGWKPAKAALELLWRMGDLAIAGRKNFHKLYDLTPRVYPDLHGQRTLSPAAHLAWAGEAAMTRLGVATPAEVAGFFNAISNADATTWCAAAARRGDIVPVTIEAADGSKPRPGYAIADWQTRADRAQPEDGHLRILSPFDPVIRDRKRLKRLFDFDYRFEAFVPEAKRTFGYYVMPVLDGETLVGRIDTKLHRPAQELEVKGMWWEQGIKATKRRKGQLDEAIDRFRTAAVRANDAK